ncbi:MAG TPA: DUF2066 domain-containing protein [Alphaproteobacteria bacterium]|nr:DUF2066 domain-containing protein [Alphaproteobacteria bacterium]
MAQSPNSAQSAGNGRAVRVPVIAPAMTLIAGLLILLAIAPVRAQTEEGVFSVSGVEVDATADTATRARDRALAQGQREALSRLFDRIVLDEDRGRLGAPDASTVAQLVRDFQVTGEKTSSVRYLAELRVRFKPDEVREYLRSRNVGFAETRSKPLLVLPVYEVSGAYSLWGSPNPWREAWNALPQANGLVPLVRPRGDVNDTAIISAGQAVQGQDASLAAIARQYGTDDVLVAVAGFRLGAAGAAGQPPQPYLEVSLMRWGSAIGRSRRTESFAVREGENEAAALSRAAAAIADQIQEAWKQSNRLRFGAVNQLTAVAPISSLGDWLDLKGRLGGIAFIRKRDLIYLSRKEAWLKIDYLGDEQQLTQALRQRDILLERGPTSWVLRRAGRPGAPAGQAPAPGPARAPGSSRGPSVPSVPATPATRNAPSPPAAATPAAPAGPDTRETIPQPPGNAVGTP